MNEKSQQVNGISVHGAQCRSDAAGRFRVAFIDTVRLLDVAVVYTKI